MAKFLQHVIIQNYGKPTFIQGWEFFARFPRASSSWIFLEATWSSNFSRISFFFLDYLKLDCDNVNHCEPIYLR